MGGGEENTTCSHPTPNEGGGKGPLTREDGFCPHRPVIRTVRDGVCHASHIQAASLQLRQLLQYEEIIGVSHAFAIGHRVRSQHAEEKKPPPPTVGGKKIEQYARASNTSLKDRATPCNPTQPPSGTCMRLAERGVWGYVKLVIEIIWRCLSYFIVMLLHNTLRVHTYVHVNCVVSESNCVVVQ